MLQTGCHPATAAAYCGIAPRTLRRWMKRGVAEKRGKYRELVVAVRRAIAMAEVRDVATIAKAAATQWKAAAWRLERRHPKRWCLKGHNRNEGSETRLSPEEHAALIRQFLVETSRQDGISPDVEPMAPPATPAVGTEDVNHGQGH